MTDDHSPMSKLRALLSRIPGSADEESEATETRIGKPGVSSAMEVEELTESLVEDASDDFVEPEARRTVFARLAEVNWEREVREPADAGQETEVPEFATVHERLNLVNWTRQPRTPRAAARPASPAEESKRETVDAFFADVQW